MKPPPEQMRHIYETHVIDAIRDENVESLDLCETCQPFADERGLHWAHTLRLGCAFASADDMIRALAQYMK